MPDRNLGNPAALYIVLGTTPPNPNTAPNLAGPGMGLAAYTLARPFAEQTVPGGGNYTVTKNRPFRTGTLTFSIFEHEHTRPLFWERKQVLASVIESDEGNSDGNSYTSFQVRLRPVHTSPADGSPRSFAVTAVENGPVTPGVFS